MEGQIRKALSGFYYVYREGVTYQTRGRGNFRNRNISPLVGDRVIFDSDNQTDGYILEILPRKNELIRPPVANVDQGIIVMSMIEPDFSSYLLDRFLVVLAYDNIDPIIYLTKTDLLKEDAENEPKQMKQLYESIGYTVIIQDSADSEDSIQELEKHFSYKTSVFIGQSGAGKSTLLNKISPNLELETGSISEALGRGKHTTRHVELLPIADGLVADTPGFSSIDFFDIEKEELSDQFPEIARAARTCKFRECLHRSEPKCEVKHQVEKGEIAQSRYDNYLQFLTEIENRKPMYKKK